MDLHLHFDGERDLVGQLYRQLRDAILSQRLQAGAQLPPSRLLAQQFQVSRKTVTEAYDRLRSEGLLHGKAGAGTFVSDLARRQADGRPGARSAAIVPLARWTTVDTPLLGAPAQASRYDFRGGQPDRPPALSDAWRQCVTDALRRPSHMGAIPPEGLPALRELIARQLAATRAVICEAADIMVTHGAQQAIDLIGRVMIEPGAVVAMEGPGYPPARAAFLSHGARLVGVPVDDEGLCVEQLPDDARLVYVTPSHQFPLGMPMSLPRRLALLEWAAARGAVIIEDDYDCEFRYQGRPLESLQNLDRAGLVAYVGSFSKTLFPELRLGYLVMPPGLRLALCKAKHLSDWYTYPLGQEALVRFLRDGALARHMRRSHKRYAVRRERLLARLDGDLGHWLQPIVPMAGFHLTAWLRQPIDTAALGYQARLVDLGIYPLAPFYHAQPARAGLMFGFGALDLAELDEGLNRLRDLLAGWPASA